MCFQILIIHAKVLFTFETFENIFAEPSIFLKVHWNDAMETLMSNNKYSWIVAGVCKICGGEKKISFTKSLKSSFEVNKKKIVS